MENPLAKKWLILAVSALALSGIFSILLIVGRTSNALDFLGIEEFFKVSLIIHVNLGVLVWLLSMTIFILGKFKKTLFYLAVLATALITISGFTYSDGAYLNNYIPMFENLFFKIGIYLFLGVVAVQGLLGIITFEKPKRYTALLMLLAAFSLICSVIALPPQETSHAYYESQFWGIGHILQYVYTFAMLISWLLLSNKLKLDVFRNKEIMSKAFKYSFLLIVISTLYISFFVSIRTGDYRDYYTQQMIWLSALAALPVGFIVLREIFKSGLKTNNKTLLWGLIFSGLLFALGGGLGGITAKELYIDGVITTLTPAHYHGSTIGVTVAFMAVIYMYLDLNTRSSLIQISAYSIGQILYIVGLAVIGGHGAARKTAGIEGLEVNELFIHMMRGGGALVLIGGLMFVVIVFRALRRTPQLSQ